MLADGGQPATKVAAEIAAFLNDARTSLDLALYDVRLETEAGALVLASLLAAHQRGVRVRLLFDVDHPGPIPVPPPPETRPEALEALPVETRGIAGIPDLMHHKFCVRDGRDVWTGSMNWTEDSWTRQENVVVRVLGSERLAFAFGLAFEQLWESGVVQGTGTVQPRPVTLDGGIEVRPWFTPGFGDALSHRVAKHLGRARERIRIASPVLTAGPILGTLVEVVSEQRCEVRSNRLDRHVFLRPPWPQRMRYGVLDIDSSCGPGPSGSLCAMPKWQSMQVLPSPRPFAWRAWAFSDCNSLLQPAGLWQLWHSRESVSFICVQTRLAIS